MDASPRKLIRVMQSQGDAIQQQRQGTNEMETQMTFKAFLRAEQEESLMPILQSSSSGSSDSCRVRAMRESPFTAEDLNDNHYRSHALKVDPESTAFSKPKPATPSLLHKFQQFHQATDQPAIKSQSPHLVDQVEETAAAVIDSAFSPDINSSDHLPSTGKTPERHFAVLLQHSPRIEDQVLKIETSLKKPTSFHNHHHHAPSTTGTNNGHGQLYEETILNRQLPFQKRYHPRVEDQVLHLYDASPAAPSIAAGRKTLLHGGAGSGGSEGGGGLPPSRGGSNNNIRSGLSSKNNSNHSLQNVKENLKKIELLKKKQLKQKKQEKQKKLKKNTDNDEDDSDGSDDESSDEEEDKISSSSSDYDSKDSDEDDDSDQEDDEEEEEEEAFVVMKGGSEKDGEEASTPSKAKALRKLSFTIPTTSKPAGAAAAAEAAGYKENKPPVTALPPPPQSTSNSQAEKTTTVPTTTMTKMKKELATIQAREKATMMIKMSMSNFKIARDGEEAEVKESGAEKMMTMAPGGLQVSTGGAVTGTPTRSQGQSQGPQGVAPSASLGTPLGNRSTASNSLTHRRPTAATGNNNNNPNSNNNNRMNSPTSPSRRHRSSQSSSRGRVQPLPQPAVSLFASSNPVWDGFLFFLNLIAFFGLLFTLYLVMNMILAVNYREIDYFFSSFLPPSI